MSIHLNDHQVNQRNQLSSKEEEVLEFALGKRKCLNSYVGQGLSLLLIPIIATIIFLLLCYNPQYHYKKERKYELLIKGIIFLVILYILERLLGEEKVEFCY